MSEFTGYLHVLPQTEEEEFEGRAKALSRVIMDDLETECWFEMGKSWDKRFSSFEYANRLKERAREIRTRRNAIVNKLSMLTIEVGAHYCRETKNIDYDTNEIEIELDGIRYIISIRSKERLEDL